MKEYIEMDNTPSTSKKSVPLTRESSFQTSPKDPELQKKVVRRNFELRAITSRSISHGWVYLPVICYFSVLVGGIMTSIGVGNAFAAFDYYCIFNANFTLIITTGRNGRWSLEDFKLNSWGNKNDCLFAEYGSVGLALFSGVWIVMVLQCGRGGASRRGFRLPDAWRIVPPTCLGNTVLFIVSCFILSNVSTGWESFCENSLLSIDGKYEKIGDTNLSCNDVLSFTYKPKDVKLRTFIEHTDLLRESRTAVVGANVQFIGCLLGFLIIILRCCTGPDFDLYERRDVVYVPANTDDAECGRQNAQMIPEENDDDDDDDYDDDDDDSPNSIATTTTVICHPAQTRPSPPSTMDDESDENSSLKSTSGLIVN